MEGDLTDQPMRTRGLVPEAFGVPTAVTPGPSGVIGYFVASRSPAQRGIVHVGALRLPVAQGDAGEVDASQGVERRATLLERAVPEQGVIVPMEGAERATMSSD